MLSLKLGIGKLLAKASTSVLRAATSALFSSPTTKSFSILPCDCCTEMQICAARCKNSPTLTKSASNRPREVMAGVPMRTPPGLSALASPNTAFLLRVMWPSSQTFSILFPEMLSGRISHRRRWLSVPPVTILYSFSIMYAASALALALTCLAYTLKEGSAACFSATVRAAIWWLWGPPWRAGNTAMSILVSKLYMVPSGTLGPAGFRPRRKKIIPERGPRRVLWVVLVTMSAYWKGLAASPPATRPLMCAMSHMSRAPTLSAMARNFA
mmetsp:Transcript_31436/g.68743  ORF Transcript_31436/g.68743 Transcript_31436/m.68743 type:complete len:269 (+) Transcript_31436:84-890(+)